MQLKHFICRSDDGSVLFPEPADRLRAVAAVVSVSGARVLWHCVVDNHAHSVVEVDDSGRLFSRNLLFAWRNIRPELELAPAHLRAVEGTRHLENLVEYIARNPEKHGLATSWPLDPGNCIADIAGARLLPGFDRERWKVHLQRWELADWLNCAGVRPEVVGVATADQVRALGAFGLERCAAALLGREALTGFERPVIQGRRAVLTVGLNAGIPRKELAAALRIAVGATYRMVANARPPHLADSLSARVRFEDVVRSTNPLQRRRERKADGGG